jgi:GNAT superfamily N-acetyltransferase
VCTTSIHPRTQRTPEYLSQTEPTSRAIEQNLADYWLALGTNARGIIHSSDSLSWEFSGGPYLNRVFGANLASDAVDQCIKRVKRGFQKRGAAVTWLVGPSSKPYDLGDHLEQHGFDRCEPWVGMSCDLTQLGQFDHIWKRLRITHVSDPDSQKDWVDVVSASYHFPDEARPVLLESVKAESGLGQSCFVHNLAYEDGVPVAASTLFIQGDVAGIYLVGTIPQRRRRGMGTALTAFALSQAARRGCRIAVLQATPAARQMYERLGFTFGCEIEVFRMSAPRPVWRRLASMIIRGPRRRSSRLRFGRGQPGPSVDLPNGARSTQAPASIPGQ